MTWAIIIAAIISVVGPYIAAWLKKHLHKNLTEVAETLSAPTSASDITKLCDVAIARLPRTAFAQRTLLRTVRRLVERRAYVIFRENPPWFKPAPLSTVEIEELTDAAECLPPELET